MTKRINKSKGDLVDGCHVTICIADSSGGCVYSYEAVYRDGWFDHGNPNGNLRHDTPSMMDGRYAWYITHDSPTDKDDSPESIALQISNDISEGIDNDDSRENLRVAVKWWADYAHEQSRLRVELEQKQKLWDEIKKLHDLL